MAKQQELEETELDIRYVEAHIHGEKLRLHRLNIREGKHFLHPALVQSLLDRVGRKSKDLGHLIRHNHICVESGLIPLEFKVIDSSGASGLLYGTWSCTLTFSYDASRMTEEVVRLLVRRMSEEGFGDGTEQRPFTVALFKDVTA